MALLTEKPVYGLKVLSASENFSFLSFFFFFFSLRNDLCNLPYLKLCINEAMRLYSPVPIICRSSDKSYDLQGRKLPKGKRGASNFSINPMDSLTISKCLLIQKYFFMQFITISGIQIFPLEFKQIFGLVPLFSEISNHNNTKNPSLNSYGQRNGCFLFVGKSARYTYPQEQYRRRSRCNWQALFVRLILRVAIRKVKRWKQPGKWKWQKILNRDLGSGIA